MKRRKFLSALGGGVVAILAGPQLKALGSVKAIGSRKAIRFSQVYLPEPAFTFKGQQMFWGTWWTRRAWPAAKDSSGVVVQYQRMSKYSETLNIFFRLDNSSEKHIQQNADYQAGKILADLIGERGNSPYLYKTGQIFEEVSIHSDTPGLIPVQMVRGAIDWEYIRTHRKEGD